MYEFTTPTLLVRHPDVIQTVLITDFSSYPDHSDFLVDSGSIMFNSVFGLSGNKWRALRNKLVVAFSTGKMRSLFPNLLEICQTHLGKDAKILSKETFTDFAIKSFMRTMFSTEILSAGEDEIHRNCRRAFEPSVKRMVQQYALTYFRKIAEFLNMSFMPYDLNNYFFSLINTILDLREKSIYVKDDYAQLLIEMRKVNKINVYDRYNNKSHETFEMTNSLALSQGFMFFFAGLDTTTNIMIHLALELSLVSEYQVKARQEVRDVLKKFGGYSWEAVREMKYLEQCIKETLRMYPSLQFLVRKCTKETELEGIKILKGTKIVIPVQSIHLDSKYYPNPYKFDPNRFCENNIMTKCTELAFSDGPRICLGKKFAMMQIATIFAHILDKYEMSVSPATTLPLKYEPNVFFLTHALNNPILIQLKKIK